MEYTRRGSSLTSVIRLIILDGFQDYICDKKFGTYLIDEPIPSLAQALHFSFISDERVVFERSPSYPIIHNGVLYSSYLGL